MLILTIVIHRPDFFTSTPVGNEVNLSFGDTVDSATEAQNNFVCEAVCNATGIFLGSCVGVLFAENLRTLCILRIEQETQHSYAVTAHRERSESHHFRACWSCGPRREIDLLRAARSLR